jgi:hypothetical protein
MKLNSRQIFGLGAIVIFGGMMIFRLTQPSEREIMERRLASLPTITAPQGPVEIPMPDLPTIPAPVPPVLALDDPGAAAIVPLPPEDKPDYAAMGSQAAKDDLYCGGILRAHFSPVLKSGGVDKAGEILELSRLLAGAGVEKLRADGLALGIDWVSFDNAHDAKASADYAAGAPRLSIAACEARGKALPADTPKLP